MQGTDFGLHTTLKSGNLSAFLSIYPTTGPKNHNHQEDKTESLSSWVAGDTVSTPAQAAYLPHQANKTGLRIC